MNRASGDRHHHPVRRPPAAGRSAWRILIVDGDLPLVEHLAASLQRNGFQVLTARDGDEALELAARELPDLVLLDLVLPGRDGSDVARRLKADARTAGIPLIIITARGDETDIVVGLTLGADDYITKPFSMKVLLARIQTVLRRARPATDVGEVIKIGPLRLDLARHEASVNGLAVRFTLTEFKLLTALARARGRVLSRDQLMDQAMGADVFVTDRAIDVHITAIRKKLGPAHWLIYTVRGVGYRLQETPG